MATHPEPPADLQGLLEELEQDRDSFPDWSDAADLTRLHIQEFAKRVAGGLELARSRGAIRFAGAGVRGHSVDFADAGEIMTRWQSLVTSAGASTEGSRSIRHLPEDIVRRTKLALTASPGSGSVVLEFAPLIDETEERYPGGELTLDGPSIPLVQKSIAVAMHVIDLASRSGLDLEDEFAELGPRVASKALDLAELAASSQVDIDLTWEEPGKGRRRSSATAHQLAQFAASLKSGSLDTESETLRGVLRTVSDRKKIDLEVPLPDSPRDRRVVSIDRGNVDFRNYRIGESVAIVTTLKLTAMPGGREKRSYIAESVNSEEETQSH